MQPQSKLKSGGALASKSDESQTNLLRVNVPQLSSPNSQTPRDKHEIDHNPWNKLL